MVRDASSQDLARCLQMGEKFYIMSGMPMGFDADATYNFLSNLMNSDEAALLVTDGGMIGGLLVPAYCNPSYIQAVELFWWSDDGSGMKLLKAFENWASDRGADEVRMTSLDAHKAADRILKSKGYEPLEISYSRAIQ
jgi:hypothetical protein